MNQIRNKPKGSVQSSFTRKQPLIEADRDEIERSLVFLARRGNMEAVEELIGRYRNFINEKAHSHSNGNRELEEDMGQVGRITVIAAIGDFDESVGTTFSTHCCGKITYMIKTESYNEKKQKLGMRRRLLSAIRLIARIEESMVADGRTPDNLAIAKEASAISKGKLGEGTVKRAREAGALIVVGTEEPEDEYGTTVGESIMDPDSKRPFDEVDNRLIFEKITSVALRLLEEERIGAIEVFSLFLYEGVQIEEGELLRAISQGTGLREEEIQEKLLESPFSYNGIASMFGVKWQAVQQWCQKTRNGIVSRIAYESIRDKFQSRKQDIPGRNSV